MATNEKSRESLTKELKTKHICRFCLSQEGILSDIYSKDTPVKSVLPLPVEIMSVASIEVFLNDGMPSTVCLKCRLIFDYCYRFKQMCKKAESLLNQVPLLGEWPAPLKKPDIPPELLMKQYITYSVAHSTKEPQVTDQIESPPKSQTSSMVVNSNETPSKPTRKILNSNPSDLPEPPIPARTKANRVNPTTSLITKIENVEEILSFLADTEDQSGGHANEQEGASSSTKTTNANKNKPRVLNKYSIRILNKDVGIDVEPRLKQPRVSHDEDGNVSIVTEIIDPNEPYETEQDPVKNTEPVETNVFPCPHCERSFPLLQLRDIHMVNHNRERHFNCEQCDGSFFSKYDLQKHVVIHTGERKYKCTVCEKGFTRPSLLHRHERIHTDIPKHLCVYCEKPFLSRDDMEKHAERHRKNRPFKCKVCTKSFAFKQGLERHEVVHSSDQPFPCQYCDKSFCTSSKLARHLVAHAGKRPFPCKFCAKSYLMSHHLTRHLRTHKNSVAMYACNECEATFKTCQDLVLHSTEHGTATLICPLCQEKFFDVDSVEAHIKRHASSESYPCEFCDLLFLTSSEQLNHVKGVHAQEWAVYGEDGNNKKYTINDEEIEEVLEDFLYDETVTPDSQNFQLSTAKIEKFEETEDDENQLQQQQQQEQQQQQQNVQYHDEQIYDDATYFRTNDELNNLANATGGEILTDITIEKQEPLAKKSKLDDAINSTETIKIESATSLRRKPAKAYEEEESLLIEKTKTRRSARGGGGGKVGAAETSRTITATTTKRNQMQNKQTANESTGGGPSSTTSNKQKTRASGQQSISQFMVKKEIDKKDSNITKVADAESGPMKMRIGDKQVRVQKIVVTKAEAAAMAKEGRICIKNGNLILTKTSK